MPTYPVKCRRCGYTDNWFTVNFEEFEKMQKETLCPQCKALKRRKKGTMFQDWSRKSNPIVLKGRGWSFDGYADPRNNTGKK